MDILDGILWFCTIVSILSTFLKASNIGYTCELYAISAICYLAFMYQAIVLGNFQQIILQLFYALIAFFGVYRRRRVIKKTD